MSFLSDAAEGNWSHLGTDISHAGSSLMNHPTEMLELGGAAARAYQGPGWARLRDLANLFEVLRASRISVRSRRINGYSAG
jgi:hypothetical protein